MYYAASPQPMIAWPPGQGYAAPAGYSMYAGAAGSVPYQQLADGSVLVMQAPPAEDWRFKAAEPGRMIMAEAGAESGRFDGAGAAGPAAMMARPVEGVASAEYGAAQPPPAFLLAQAASAHWAAARPPSALPPAPRLQQQQVAGAAGSTPQQQQQQPPPQQPGDDRDVRRQRRKQSNRESARRSRLRKQAECEGLGARVALLVDENAALREAGLFVFLLAFSLCFSRACETSCHAPCNDSNRPSPSISCRRCGAWQKRRGSPIPTRQRCAACCAS